MATYIILVRFTQQGIQNIKQGPTRLDAAKQTFRAIGAEMKEFYSVMGKYDIVLVVEAPDDETMAKVTLAIGSLGNVRTETLRAFTEDEYRKVIADLP